MTIGVGFFHSDTAVVLGSDMEATGGGTLKYPIIKDYFKWFDKESGIIAAVYSGQESDMKLIWEQIGSRIEANGRVFPVKPLEVSGARRIVEESVSQVIGKRKDTKFEMLVGISKENQHIFLKVFEKTIWPGERWEIIGWGNNELSRYLVSFMSGTVTVYQALLWTAHIIGTARRFVQYVGQGTRLSVIANGKVAYFDGEMYSDKIATAENNIADLWCKFCNLDAPQEEFKKASEALCASLLAIRAGFPKTLDYLGS
jgi:hypothetical protein